MIAFYFLIFLKEIPATKMVNVCATCSGTQFHTMDGYYYCQECGTQSQNHQVEMEADNVMVGDRVIGGDVVTLKKVKSSDARITSWEEYNYILIGLVDELINLGANNRFKKCVLKLWTRYLQTIEAAFFSLDDECLPRLPANYRKRDAEILYNKHHRKRQRRRRNSCTSQESAETKSSTGKADSVIKSFKISKIIKKTKVGDCSILKDGVLTEKYYFQEELARAQFEDYKRLENDSSSVATSLATSSQHSSTDAKSNVSLKLGFTRNARKMLKRKMDQSHIKKHESDYEDALDCHTKRISKKQHDKVENLDNAVLLAIIYLALNLTQDDIQCSDLIRFLREGHVSYYNIQHFLPENIKQEENSNFEALNRRAVFNHFSMRSICAKLFRDMAITELVRPNLVSLVHRYVDELQLPEELKVLLEKVMAFHPPSMEYTYETRNKFCLPNYEGRAMSYIIFTLKMLFGFDDDRETRISNSAREVNKLLSESPELKLFVVEDWLRMLKVRQMVIKRHHMPSAVRQPWQSSGSMTRGVGNWRMYVDHIKTMYQSKMPEERKLKCETDRSGVAYNTMLLLSGLQQKNHEEVHEEKSSQFGAGGGNGPDKSYHFPASMTPYSDYAKVLLEDHSKLELPLQGTTATHLSEDYSLSSLQAFYGDKVITGQLKKALKNRHALNLKVKELGLTNRELHIVRSDYFMENEIPTCMMKVEVVSKEDLDDAPAKKKDKTPEVRLPIKVDDSPLKRGDLVLNISDMDYWMYYHCYHKIKMPFLPGWDEVLRILPNNFKFLMFECARIIEQDPRFMCLELAVLERVLIYEKAGEAEPKGYKGRPPKHMW